MAAGWRFLMAGALVLTGLPAMAAPSGWQVAQTTVADPFVQSKFDEFARRLAQIDGFAAAKDEDRVLEASQLLESFVKREAVQLGKHPDFPALNARFWQHRLTLVPMHLEGSAVEAKAGRQRGAEQQFSQAKAIVEAYRAWDGKSADILAKLDSQLAAGSPSAGKPPAVSAARPPAGKPQPPATKPGPAATGDVDAETSSRQLPPNYYRGRDTAQLTTQIKREWLRVYPRDKVLAVRFPEDGWEDRSRSDYNSAAGNWQHFNHSRMRAVVVVQETGTVAAFYTITMVKRPSRGIEVQVDSNEKAQDPNPYRMLIRNIR